MFGVLCSPDTGAFTDADKVKAKVCMTFFLCHHMIVNYQIKVSWNLKVWFT